MDALMAQYYPDATIIGFDFTLKGHAAIRKHFECYLERLGTLKQLSIFDCSSLHRREREVM